MSSNPHQSSNPYPLNNQQQTLGKGVIVGRLGVLAGRLDRIRDAFHCAKNKTKADPQTGKTPILHVQEDMMQLHGEMTELINRIKANLAEETTLGREYNKELFERTLALTRKTVLERFGHQPNICATLDMFMLLLQTNLDFHAHFLHLRTQCAVEDRTNNPSSYGVDGEPNKKGRNECDHCSHVV